MKQLLTITKFLLLALFVANLSLAQTVIYENDETLRLVDLVNEAVHLVENKGEVAFEEFARKNSRWNQGENYIFVIDMEGMIITHPDKKLSGKNQLELKDINGKPFIRWFIYEVTGKSDNGWSHYLWVKPGQMFPAWKTTYVKLAIAPSGKKYVIGSGKYNMKMEKAFIIESVNDAEELLKKMGQSGFEILRDAASEYRFKDTYVFVMDETGTLLVHPPFPNLEKTNLYNYTDANGKYIVREIVDTAQTGNYGWVEYMWPKPGEHLPSRKISYVKKITTSEGNFIVGVGVYQ